MNYQTKTIKKLRNILFEIEQNKHEHTVFGLELRQSFNFAQYISSCQFVHYQITK